MALPKNPFDASVTDLDTVGVAPTEFDIALSDQIREDTAKSLTPDPVEVSDANIVDVEAQGNISVKRDPLTLQTFDLLNKTDPDAKSDTDILGFDVDEAADIAVPNFAQPENIHRGTGPTTKLPNIDASGKPEEATEEELPDQVPDFGVEPDIDALYEKIQDKALDYGSQGLTYLRNLYGTYAPRSAAGINQLGQPMYGSTRLGLFHGISPTATSGASAPMGMAGMGYGSLQTPNAVQQAQQAVAALGPQAPQFANQAMLGQISGGGYGGLSSSVATGASQLATSGAGVNAFGQPMYGSTAAKSSGASVFGQAASIYGIYDGIKNKDYFSAGTALITLLNPATAIPMAVLHGAKMLFGAFSASKRPKPKFGGAEFKAEKNRLMATEGYGYNGYQPSAGKATVASIADYVNTYVKAFGLQFNGTRWAKAIEADPRLNRYDTMDDSGYRDPSVLARKIFETDGLITGTPTYFGQPITSQEDYKAKMEEFNDYYKKTALERGGLVDAAAVGINPDTLSNEHDKITFKTVSQVSAPGGQNYTTRITGGGRGGGGTTQAGYWKHSYYGSTWVPAPANVQVTPAGYNTGSSGYTESYRYEDATPFDMLYKNLVGNFNRGQGGTYY